MRIEQNTGKKEAVQDEKLKWCVKSNQLVAPLLKYFPLCNWACSRAFELLPMSGRWWFLRNLRSSVALHGLITYIDLL